MKPDHQDAVTTSPPQSRSPLGRWAQLLLGLFLYGVSVAFMIRSGLGLGPWDAFHVGIHLLTGITVGTASIGVGALIVLGTLLIGVRPGTGTVANMVLIGVFIDLMLPVVPEAGGWLWALGIYTLGVILCGFATGLYIGAGMGKGPRDGLMIGVSQLSGWPVRRVRTLIEVSVLAAGWAMGGVIGIGTVLFTFGIGPATQWGLQLFGYSAHGAEVPRPSAAPELARRAAPEPAPQGELAPADEH